MSTLWVTVGTMGPIENGKKWGLNTKDPARGALNFPDKSERIQPCNF